MLGEVFEFRPDWHQADRSLPLVRQYHAALDAVLKAYLDRPLCAVHCRHCAIRFLTPVCNAQRPDLLCPFGCRQHARRQAQRERSKRYYRTDSGRRKKKRLNARRRVCGPPPREHAPPEITTGSLSAAPDHVPPATKPLRATPHAPRGHDVQELSPVAGPERPLEERLAASPLLPYLTVIVSLIVNRVIRREELLEALTRSWRQRRVGGRWPIDYVSLIHQQHPP